MSRRSPCVWFLAATVAALCALSCTQKMAVQPSYRPFQPAEDGGTSARAAPLDTVARGQLAVIAQPTTITPELLDRGQQRFDIYCAPCHGFVGDGGGMIVQRGFTPPPSFHSDRLRQVPDSHFFDVVTSGTGAMPSYANQVAPADRWAIVAYIRALQLSQNATL